LLQSNLGVLNKIIKEKWKEEAEEVRPGDDGTFFICYADWRKVFTNFFVCIDFPDHWSGLRVRDAWTAMNSGGLPNKTKESAIDWAKNPQYIVEINSPKPVELFITLGQEDGRIKSKGNDAFPFQKYHNQCMLLLGKLEDSLPGEPPQKFKIFPQSNEIVEYTNVAALREISLKVPLSANITRGNFVIVPRYLNPLYFANSYFVESFLGK
jgi:hypothetical protein